MEIYKAISLKELLGIDFLKQILPDIKNMKLKHLNTNGLSGSKMYKLTLIGEKEEKVVFLKVNNLKEDWVAKISKDKGRELIIFKEGIYGKLQEFVKDVYLAYYEGKDSYAILMNDMSEYIISEEVCSEYYVYIDHLAKFHAKFKEQDVLTEYSLLDVEGYYNFLTKTNVNEIEERIEDNQYGWNKIKEHLGEELYNKYINLKDIDTIFGHYPKTFLHGDYRPANTLLINKDEIRFIDWANSGCGPCTLDLFWYLMTSVDTKIDRTEFIDYYKTCLEKYNGYKFTKKTWDTLLKVGMLCACKMFLALFISDMDSKDKHSVDSLYWWIENLKEILAS
ncbi:MAG: phosphotransferase [Peptostreptococcaceae bacterium]